MVSIHLQINTWLTTSQDHHRNMLLNEKTLSLVVEKRRREENRGRKVTDESGTWSRGKVVDREGVKERNRNRRVRS